MTICIERVRLPIFLQKGDKYAKTEKEITITTQKGTPVINCNNTQPRYLLDGSFNIGATVDQNVKLLVCVGALFVQLLFLPVFIILLTVQKVPLPVQFSLPLQTKDLPFEGEGENPKD